MEASSSFVSLKAGNSRNGLRAVARSRPTWPDDGRAAERSLTVKRSEFIPILNLAVVSAFPEVDDVCLHEYDILHVYFHDQSFREINIAGRSNSDLLLLISSDLWIYRPSLLDVQTIKAKIVDCHVEFQGKKFTDVRLHEYDGEDVLIAEQDGFLWVWRAWNQMVITSISLRYGQ